MRWVIRQRGGEGKRQAGRRTAPKRDLFSGRMNVGGFLLILFLTSPVFARDLHQLTFREFLEHRPAYIEAALVSSVIGLPGGTITYYIRWQTNAGFYAAMPGDRLAEFSIQKDPKWFAQNGFVGFWWNDEFYYVNLPDYSAWTNRNAAPEDIKISSMPNVRGMEGSCLPELFNLGIQLVPPGELIFQDNMLIGTNRQEKLMVKGHIVRKDEKNRIKEIRLGKVRLGILSILKKRLKPLKIFYFYEDDQFPYLPTRIETIADNMKFRDSIRWMELLDRPKGRDAFVVPVRRLAPLIEQVTTVSNGVYVTVKLQESKVILHYPTHLQKKYPLFRIISLIGFLLALGAPVIVIVKRRLFHRKKAGKH